MSWKIRFEKEIEDCTECPLYDYSEDYHHIGTVDFHFCFAKEKRERFHKYPTFFRPCPLKEEECS